MILHINSFFLLYQTLENRNEQKMIPSFRKITRPSGEKNMEKTNSITKCHVMCPSSEMSAEDRKQHSPFCLAPPRRASKRRQPVRGNPNEE